MCHLCICGQGIDWEDLKAADEAMDASYVEEIQTPWSRESPLTRLLLHDAGPNGKSKFHQMDIWHAIHLGIGKSWIASGVLMLQKIIPESNIDKRVAVIAAGYKDFCKREKIDPVIRRIDKETFGQSSKERTGSWNKAAVTSNFMRYLEDFCREHAEQIRGDERLKIFCFFPAMAHGTQCVNRFMKGIYEQDVFIDSGVAGHLSDCLYQFIAAYCYQADAAFQAGEVLFALFPKLHAVHE
ncbi:unnamed protein product, partial [Durusdinium trenchii]